MCKREGNVENSEGEGSEEVDVDEEAWEGHELAGNANEPAYAVSPLLLKAVVPASPLFQCSSFSSVSDQGSTYISRSELPEGCQGDSSLHLVVSSLTSCFSGEEGGCLSCSGWDQRAASSLQDILFEISLWLVGEREFKRSFGIIVCCIGVAIVR